MIVQLDNCRCCWYVSTGTYQPGRVNCVKFTRVGPDLGFRLWVTDGYKTQPLGQAATRDEALAMAADAMAYGAGGGFTSRFEAAGRFR